MGLKLIWAGCAVINVVGIVVNVVAHKPGWATWSGALLLFSLYNLTKDED